MERLNWSQQYFHGLTPFQHTVNNTWFETMFEIALKDDGILYVPVLNKHFNKEGKEMYRVIQGGKKDA